MRLGPERVGPRGLALLGAAGVLGLVLAVHGYGNGAVVAGGTLGTGSVVTGSAGGGTATSSPTTTKPSSGGGSTSGGGTTTTDPSSGSTTTTTKPSSGGTKQKLGPPLASAQYANYAYQVYPGPLSSQAKTATTGFTVKVTPSSGTIHVSVSAVGTSSAPQTSSYPTGDKVYFVETTLGDDSSDTDYNFGDDGVVVTNAKGRIVK